MDKDGLLKQLESYKNELADVSTARALQAVAARSPSHWNAQTRARTRLGRRS